MRSRFVAAVAVVLFVAGACSSEPERDASGEITDAGTADIFDVRVGDCVNDTTEEGGEASSIQAVPCSDPHNAQAFHADEVTGIASFDEEAIQMFVDDACYEAFPDFVGIAWEDSVYEYFFYYPTASGWDLGDRDLTCYVWAPTPDGSGRTLTSSLEGVAE